MPYPKKNERKIRHGHYWHGHLSKKKFKQLEGTRQLERIKRHMKVDKEQNKVIKNLVRITDIEFNKNKQVLIEKINVFVS